MIEVALKTVGTDASTDGSNASNDGNLKDRLAKTGWKLSDQEKGQMKAFALRKDSIDTRVVAGRSQKTARLIDKEGEPFTQEHKLKLHVRCNIQSLHDIDMQRQTFSVRIVMCQGVCAIIQHGC